MKKQDRQGWKKNSGDLLPEKPRFYLTEKEKKDRESSLIQRWMDLADRMFENDDSDPTPSAA